MSITIGVTVVSVSVVSQVVVSQVVVVVRVSSVAHDGGDGSNGGGDLMDGGNGEDSVVDGSMRIGCIES